MSAANDAAAALNYVRNTIGVRSVNNPADAAAFAGRSPQSLMDLSTAYRSANIPVGNEVMAKEVAASAIAAKKFRIGNCEAQASLAYCYVVEQAASPTRLMALGGDYDHSFIVVGPKRGNFMDPTTWGDGVFVCDPWANEVYGSDQILVKMRALHQATNGAGGIDPGDGAVATRCQLDSQDRDDRLPYRVT
jgi:hypothetical protein